MMALTGRQALKIVSLAINMGPCSQGSEVCTWTAVIYTASFADLFLAQGMNPLQALWSGIIRVVFYRGCTLFIRLGDGVPWRRPGRQVRMDEEAALCRMSNVKRGRYGLQSLLCHMSAVILPVSSTRPSSLKLLTCQMEVNIFMTFTGANHDPLAQSTEQEQEGHEPGASIPQGHMGGSFYLTPFLAVC